VVARARQVLDRLESEAASHEDLAELPLFALAAPAAPAFSGPSEVETALAELDPDGMSPREAMDALYRLKGMLGR
jgi:DNA mismatch repair protein MutS